MEKPSIAVVGATGLVGTTLLDIIIERQFPYERLYLLASQQSAGQSLNIAGQEIIVQALEEFDFSQTQLAFFCVNHALAAKYIPIATRAGNIIIDKSSCYRNDPHVPLIVPEVNLETLTQHRAKMIIANPNCSTIPIAVALKPIYDAVGIERINVSTYQSVSGSGKEGCHELKKQTEQLLKQQPIESKTFAQQIAFNVLPHCDDFNENGYTLEEMKIVLETKKIFNNPNLAVNPTAVRVPVFCGHSAAIHVELQDRLTATQAINLLHQAPGIKLMLGKQNYATPAYDAVGRDEVFVGRIREDISHPRGLNLWVVTDNLRKGAALNALQIAENLLEN